MADSTFGTVRSLLVDSSVFDSRMAETSKEHTFLCLTSEDAEGKQAPLLATINMNLHCFFKLVISFNNCKGDWMSFFPLLFRACSVWQYFYFLGGSLCHWAFTMSFRNAAAGGDQGCACGGCGQWRCACKGAWGKNKLCRCLNGKAGYDCLFFMQQCMKV